MLPADDHEPEPELTILDAAWWLDVVDHEGDEDPETRWARAHRACLRHIEMQWRSLCLPR